MVRFLAISGSLRSASSNSRLLQAAAAVAPAGVGIIRYERLGSLPHFNPEVEARGLPVEVAELRRLVAETDAIIISSPEYATALRAGLSALAAVALSA